MYVRNKYAGSLDTDVMEDTSEWIVNKNTHVSYHAEMKDCNDLIVETLREAYQLYLDSPLGSRDVQDNNMAFKFAPEGTNYEVSLLFSGAIKKIKLVLPEGRVPTADEIIEMSEWANRELSDIVEKAAICKKVEEQYEPDTETETKEVCRL